MALVLADRVRDSTTTTGTGSVTLSGTAVTGFQNFSVIGNGNTTYYTIAGQGTAEYEVGIGTYTTAGPTLARTTILASSNANALVNFSAGTKDVFVTYPAGKSVNLDASGNATALGTPVAFVGTNITGTAAGLTAGNVTTNANLTGAVTSVGNATSLGSFTSAQLLAALTNETGTGVAVFGTSPAITTSLTTASTTFALLNTAATTINFGGAATTLNLGAATGTMTVANTTLAAKAITASTTLGVTGVSTFAAGTVALPAITTTGDTNTGVYFPAADTIGLTTGGTERLRIDSAGLTSATGTFSVTGVSTLTGGAVIQGLTVGLGAGAQSNNTAIGVSALSSITTGNSNTGVGWNACATVAVTGHNTGIGNEALKLNLTGSQNTAVGSGAFAINTSGSSNTGLGYVAGQNCTGATNTFLGYFSGAGVSTGSNNVILGSYQGGAAPISGSGSNYIVLSDGAGTVRQTIDPSGNAQFPTGAVVMYAPAPASFAALATLTNADLQTQLIVTTGTSFTLTMPLGSTLDSLISWTGNDLGYDFSVINTASSTITMAVNTGVTFVGRLSVTTQVSGRFRIRRTAASTYIVYRIG